MQKNNFLKFLGICKKSGKLISGDYSVEKGILKNKISLIILSEDASKEKVSKFTKLASTYKIDIITYFNKEELGLSIGRALCSVIGLTDENQKKKVMNLYKDIDN
ncbi:MAG: L7Ae/L30e/S12e/Gadd45 family ribosomal protein [Eubacteriaceae bacterium]